MKTFNLAEELEKERKKNKEYNQLINGLSRENKELQEHIILAVNLLKERQERIDKAIEYIEKNYPVCAGEDLLKILKGE